MASYLISLSTDFNQGVCWDLVASPMDTQPKTMTSPLPESSSSPIVQCWGVWIPPPITDCWQDQSCVGQVHVTTPAVHPSVTVMATSCPDSPSPCLLLLHSFYSLLYRIHSLSLREAWTAKSCVLWTVTTLFIVGGGGGTKNLNLALGTSFICSEFLTLKQLFKIFFDHKKLLVVLILSLVVIPVPSSSFWIVLVEGWGCQAGGHGISRNHDSNFYGSLLYFSYMYWSSNCRKKEKRLIIEAHKTICSKWLQMKS